MKQPYTPTYNTNAAEIMAHVHLSGAEFQAVVDSTINSVHGYGPSAAAYLADELARKVEQRCSLAVPKAGTQYTAHLKVDGAPCEECATFLRGAAQANQCDGCQARMPIKNGMHYRKQDGRIHMACEAKLYYAAV